MLKLTVMVKRHPSLGVEEFHERWREHGRMIADDPELARYIQRYEQHHRNAADYRTGDTFDGMVMQWFTSHREFVAMLADPAYVAKVRPDEERLLDAGALVVIFTDEAEVFIDG
jgi:hypothetical protein